MIASVDPARKATDAPFEELYRTSRQDVFVYVASLLRDRSLAEDVTATAFERAYRRASSFDARRGSRRAWLFGIARNAALDELRRRKRITALEDEPVADAVPAVESAEASIRRTALQEAMRGLSARERELVGLKFFAGLKTAEIASVISASEAATAMRIHRTIEKLRRACNEAQ
ncbi:MAG: sigma-70 family RNA polymerase sigma factor [Actinomycetota bacterium]|nr:sigma-70 family RNA polymerase sigma factor [Actinomycetota bacterium]